MPPISKQPKYIKIKIIAQDDGWIMGESLALEVYPDITLANLANIIRVRKIKTGTSINPRRMKFFLQPNRLISQEKWTKSLKECGIFDGTVIRLEPTSSGCWLWHPMDYYRDQVLDKIKSVIPSGCDCQDETQRASMSMDEVQKLVPLPPPMRRTDFVSFIRMYPELFYVEHDRHGDMTVEWNIDGRLPVWLLHRMNFIFNR